MRSGRAWLGAPETTHYGQTASQEFTWSLLGGVNGSHDFEHDPAESGIADNDGLNEQMGAGTRKPSKRPRR